MKPALRDDLRSISAYMAPQVEAPVQLNTNESAYPPPDALVRDLAEALTRIPLHRYPDRAASSLREALASHTGHPAAGIWVANGSNEVLQHLCLAYGGPGSAALVFEPTFSLHHLIPEVLGMTVHRERLGEDFRLGPEAVEAARRHRPAVAFICSPNNPTGNAQRPEIISDLCEAVDGLVVVDEAYGEFGTASARPLLDLHDNLVVTRTFSKAFSLAGARLGYAMTSPEIVADMPTVRLPYHLSALTQTAGEVALQHAAEALAIVGRLAEQRDRIVDRLASLDAVEVFPSDANFVLFRTPAGAPALWQRLLDRGVLVRDVSTYPGLERCLRVTAGTPEETGAFLDALPDALEEAR